MKIKIKLLSLLALACVTCAFTTQAQDVAPDAQGFYTCSVQNEAGDTMYVTASAFAGQRGKDKALAQAFADEVLKTHPEAGSLGYPMCNFGIEAKYADMYLDRLKGQFSGDLQTVAFAPAN